MSVLDIFELASPAENTNVTVLFIMYINTTYFTAYMYIVHVHIQKIKLRITAVRALTYQRAQIHLVEMYTFAAI